MESDSPNRRSRKPLATRGVLMSTGPASFRGIFGSSERPLFERRLKDISPERTGA